MTGTATAPVAFVDTSEDPDTLAIPVACDLWHFIGFLLRSEIGVRGRPFDPDHVPAADPALSPATGAPLPWLADQSSADSSGPHGQVEVRIESPAHDDKLLNHVCTDKPMIDKKTSQRIVVQMHDENGPYITVSTGEDAQALQHLFDARYYVLYWTDVPDALQADGGCRIFFGNGAGVGKVQAILDGIDLEL